MKVIRLNDEDYNTLMEHLKGYIEVHEDVVKDDVELSKDLDKLKYVHQMLGVEEMKPT